MDIRAEVLTIGDEILWGQITDTNSQFISATLTDIGVRTVQKTSVGDTEQAILDGLRAALSRADIVLLTGGLGPTKDDITKKTLATFFGAELAEREEAWEDLQVFFERRKRPINPLNRLQATLPTNAVYIKNERGTAPGMWFDVADNKAVVSMPGVPAEMKFMLQNYILPRIKAQYPTPSIVHSFIQTVGIPESDLAIKIEAWENTLPPHVKLAYLPSRGKVKLRLTGMGEDVDALAAELGALGDAAIPILEHTVYSRKDEELEQAVGSLFMAKKLTLAAAESCTGGAFAARITAHPGVSAFFKGSAVVYTEAAKEALGVDPEIIRTYRVVSAECAIAMAEAAKAFYQADYAVACTGEAGPISSDPEVPVGTIFIACAGPSGTVHKALNFTPDRATNIELTVVAMLNLVRLGL